VPANVTQRVIPARHHEHPVIPAEQAVLIPLPSQPSGVLPPAPLVLPGVGRVSEQSMQQLQISFGDRPEYYLVDHEG
jgi:hypothetical protein